MSIVTTRCVVPMLSKRTTKHEFDVIVYGRLAEELATIPNKIIMYLATQFPGHESSVFLVHGLSTAWLEEVDGHEH